MLIYYSSWSHIFTFSMLNLRHDLSYSTNSYWASEHAPCSKAYRKSSRSRENKLMMASPFKALTVLQERYILEQIINTQNEKIGLEGNGHDALPTTSDFVFSETLNISIIISFSRLRNWNVKRLHNWPKITDLAPGKLGARPPSGYLPHPSSCVKCSVYII